MVSSVLKMKTKAIIEGVAINGKAWLIGHPAIDRKAKHVDGPATKPRSITASKAPNKAALLSSGITSAAIVELMM
jgi:hypothetical protein